MRGTLVSEWTKLRTLPSTIAALLGVVALTTGLGAFVGRALNPDDCLQRPGSSCDIDLTKASLAGVYLGQTIVVLLGVLAVTAEYETSTIRWTLAASPRRARVLAAKAMVVATMVIGASTVAVLGSLVVGRTILPGNGFTEANGYPALSLADEPTLRAYLGTVAYLALVALLSLGIATAVRFTGAAITAVLTLLFGAPIVASVVTDPRWSERIHRYSPMTAGLAIQNTKRLAEAPIGPWAGLGMLAVYAAAALLLGLGVLLRRDA